MLEVRNVYKSFEVPGMEHMVLDGLSFTVQDRDFYIIPGQSDCGKGTLFRMIGGSDRPGKGEMLLDGGAVSGPSKDMMMVSQSFDQLFSWLAPKGSLVYVLKKAGILPEGNNYGQYAVRYPIMAGPGEFQDSCPHQPSGGMKQKGVSTRAPCLRPRLLLMGELLSSPDYMIEQGLYKNIGEIADQTEATVVMMTHDTEGALVLGTPIEVLSPETGRFAGVWNREAEGSAPETGDGPETYLQGICGSSTLYTQMDVYSSIPSREIILGPYMGFPKVPIRVQSDLQ